MENSEKEELEKQETAEGNEEAGKTGTQTVKNEGEAFKTFQTEKEYQDAVDSILKNKLPSKEEMKAFKKWQEDQKTEAQKQAERETEYQKVNSRNTELENENKVFKAGVSKDDVDYVAFKVAKMEGEFDENLAKFLKENPKYLGNSEPQIVKKVSSSLNLSGKEKTNQNETNQIMNDLIRSARD